METIYTSTDKKEVQELLEKYEVNYIFIGSCEYQKYEGVNVALLSSLGEIVFKEENTIDCEIVIKQISKKKTVISDRADKSGFNIFYCLCNITEILERNCGKKTL